MRLFHRRPSEDAQEATRARQDAEEALAAERRKLEAMKAETSRYADLAQTLRGHRERNHISERLTALYLGRQS